jgi:hypothetical protein
VRQSGHGVRGSVKRRGKREETAERGERAGRGGEKMRESGQRRREEENNKPQV